MKPPGGLLAGGADEEDRALDRSLRPQTFADYVGQERTKENLELMIQAARERGEPLEHLLFHGPPGLVKTSLKPFTLIAATTRAGLLSAPLRNRFGNSFRLDFYSEPELQRILGRSAELLGVPLEREGGEEIAGRSRGTPRIANRLLRRARDFAQVRADGII